MKNRQTGNRCQPFFTRSRRRWFPLVSALVMLLFVGAAAGCSRDNGGDGDGKTTLSTTRDSDLGDIEGVIGADIEVGEAVVTVRALEIAFQPAMPTQRLSDETPTAPAAGESFYQAYVRVANGGDLPIRVDPNDFLCMVGNILAKIEASRSGPVPRSLIGGTSLDLLLTFKAPSGYEATLLYSPPWHSGLITVSPANGGTPSTSTTEA